MLIRLFLALFLSTFTNFASADDKVYLVGVEDVDYFPLFSFNKSGVIRPSFAQELLQTFFEFHSIKFKFVPLPVKRFDKWYLEHNIDFKFPDNFRWRNDQSNKLGITFSEPIISLTAGTYVLKKNKDINRRDVDSIVTIRGFHPSLWLREISKNKVTLYEESTPLAIVRHLLTGNSIATNIDLNVINTNLRKLNKEGEVVLAEGIFHEQYAYHFSSIRYPEIITKFNQFLIQNKALVDEIKAKYYLSEP